MISVLEIPVTQPQTIGITKNLMSATFIVTS